MNEAKRGKWIVSETPDSLPRIVVEVDGEPTLIVSDRVFNGFAPLIVEAVNAYHGLLEEVETLRAMTEEACEHMPSPRWRKQREGLYAVAISDHLQLTPHGLGRAILKIPYRERLGSTAYQFGTEWREGKQRWIEVACNS